MATPPAECKSGSARGRDGAGRAAAPGFFDLTVMAPMPLMAGEPADRSAAVPDVHFMAKTPLLPHEIHYTPADAVASAFGATLLIVSEMLGAIFAFAWAIGGLLGMGDEFRYILMVIFGVPGLWLSLSLTRRILRVEKKLRTIIPE
jgi:hypothetical protein